MTFYVENETGEDLPFDVEGTVELVCEAVLKAEDCPYEVQVNVVLTDDEGIRELNRECRGIDRATDVLSFPGLEFRQAGVFRVEHGREADAFDPDTGELMLGDVMLSMDRVRMQAAEYGHSLRREFAFLIAHSMFHLCGYDHETEPEARIMEEKQEKVLEGLGITREGSGENE